MAPWTRKLTTAGADRMIVCFSDVEMGAGGPYDDFPHSDALGELILSYNEPPFAELGIDLVFNGDTFDLLKTSYLGEHPTQISADVGLGKMSRVAAAHPRFFEAIRHFVSHTVSPRQVHFVVGNHDFELLFDEVQGFVRSLCGGSELIRFPGFELALGKVFIEHGSQGDVLFRMDPEEPFFQVEGKTLLNLPFGSVGLLDVVMAWQPLLHFHDRVVPRNLLMELIPELKQLYSETFWGYWTRDFWKGYFRDGDPMKRLTWTMIKEVGSRLLSKDANVAIDTDIKDRMMTHDDYDVYLMGHLHEATLMSYGHRRALMTGCLRNEYMLLNEGHVLLPIPKSYAEILMAGEQPVRTQLVELPNLPPPQGYIPESIFDVRPAVREMLAPEEKQQAEQRAQEAQEKKEAENAADNDD